MTQSNDTIPYGFCHCGCGERTTIATRNHYEKGALKGEPRRFKQGHNGTRTPLYVIDSETGCWNWLRGVFNPERPYGRIQRNGRLMPAHRLIWEQLRGPIPDGLELHHKCENTRCVNPDHMEPLTPKEHTATKDWSRRRRRHDD
jgi:hypothetical protein